MPDSKAILEHLLEISDRTSRIEESLKPVKEDLKSIKADLKYHIEGTVTNRQRLDLEIKSREFLEAQVKDQHERLSFLEAVPQFFQSAKNIMLYVAVPIGIVYEAGRILRKW